MRQYHASLSGAVKDPTALPVGAYGKAAVVTVLTMVMEMLTLLELSLLASTGDLGSWLTEIK